MLSSVSPSDFVGGNGHFGGKILWVVSEMEKNGSVGGHLPTQQPQQSPLRRGGGVSPCANSASLRSIIISK